MGTASAVGGWYVIGGGICNVLSDHVKGLTLTPQVTGGSVENVRLLANDENELIMIGANTLNLAMEGKEPFTQKYEDMYGLFTFGGTVLHVVVRKDSGITSLDQLVDKKVAIGPPGSGTESMAQVMFRTLGITDEVKMMPMAFADMYDALRDKNIDCFLLEASPPGPALEELARTTEIMLLNISEELANSLHETDPSVIPVVLPGGTYSGVDQDMNITGAASMVVCRLSMPEDVAYNIVKGVYTYLDEIQAVHAGAKSITPETAIDGITIPLHPGAEKYFKEVGLIP